MPNRQEALPIAVRNITKTYGSLHALDDVSIDIESGEFLTLLGPSGSGKTTLLMVLAGFTRPDCGSLKFGDDEMIRTPPHLRNVGMTFQSYALFPHMSVAGNIGYPLRIRKIAKSEANLRIERALETVRLEGLADRRIDQLSGGQKQRVAVARAIVFEPRILLMDEPLSALDKKLRDQMQIELRHLHGKLGMTTVYVTHDQREALTMSDRIAVINKGKIMQLASPRDIYERPANRFVADFIGESTFLDITRKGEDILYHDIPLKMETPPPDAERLLLMIRPERITLADDSARGSAGNTDKSANLFPATATEVVYQGDSYLLHARLPKGDSIVMRGMMRSAGGSLALPAVGDRITLSLAPEDTILIDAGDE
ncbi:MAG: ABC transporter ATP-binding protein [Ectothiorhodospiraceae bacterium AqS1]|nr:ABC transporter ATP-binding protein [Ectothiorhodospiraceae bacterium AqS1]